MNFFDNYFVFSSSEKRGILLFIILIFLVCLLYVLIPYLFQPSTSDFSSIKSHLSQFENQQGNQQERNSLFPFNPNKISKDSLLLLGLSFKQANNIINYRQKVGKFDSENEFRKLYSLQDTLVDRLSPFLVFENKKVSPLVKNNKSKVDLFPFDPNKINKDSLILLGFSSKQATTLIKYRKKGGKFYKPEDLSKIYSVSKTMYQKLEPFIEIQESKKSTPPQVYDRKKLAIDINQDNVSEFEKINGIGKKLGERIIKYRDRLGGFYSINQLKEVYGLDSNLINDNKAVFFIFKKKITKISLNTVTFKELLSHPYFSYSTTQKIINYREQHGNFSSVEEILNNNLIKPEQYRKIVSYISLE